MSVTKDDIQQSIQKSRLNLLGESYKTIGDEASRVRKWYQTLRILEVVQNNLLLDLGLVKNVERPQDCNR